MVRRKRWVEIVFALPWWVPAVLADAVYFSPDIAVQFYPPTKSEQGLPVYSELVMNIDMISPYLAALLVVFALLALLRKTMLVRKKAHHSVKRAGNVKRSKKD
ncbi:MAG: hypothetical protein Q9M16_05090 [Mariprofundus sp.]|nr:hypothetical protein [Mariprofundus sp.]